MDELEIVLCRQCGTPIIQKVDQFKTTLFVRCWHCQTELFLLAKKKAIGEMMTPVEDLFYAEDEETKS